MRELALLRVHPGLTTSAICDTWQKIKLVRGTKPPSGNRPNRQTYMQQAKALADQGVLPAIGGGGTMTFAEFLTLPKPHQMNTIKKVLRTMHGLKNKKDNVEYLPQVGQNARSYTLENNKCISQCGVIKAYTGNPDSPYKVVSTQDAGIEIDCKLDVLQGRLEGPEGLTGEEQSLKDKLVVKYFETEPLSANQKLKQTHKLERGEKLKKIQGMALFQGGVYDITRDGNRSLISLLYPIDPDKEDLEVAELLTQTAPS